MNKKKAALAILLIMLFSWCSFRGYDTNFFQTTKPFIKHLINFSLLAATAFTGYFGLASYKKSWVIKVWCVVYIAVIILLIVAGIIDLLSRLNTYSLREMIANTRMLFTSPLPFALVLYLSNARATKQLQHQNKSVDDQR